MCIFYYKDLFRGFCLKGILISIVCIQQLNRTTAFYFPAPLLLYMWKYFERKSLQTCKTVADSGFQIGQESPFLNGVFVTIL